METGIVSLLEYVAEGLEEAVEYIDDRMDSLEGDRALVGEFPYEPEKLLEAWLEGLRTIRERLASIEPVELAKTVEMTREDIDFLLDLIDDYYAQVEKAQIGTSISLAKLDEVQQKLEAGRRRK